MNIITPAFTGRVDRQGWPAGEVAVDDPVLAELLAEVAGAGVEPSAHERPVGFRHGQTLSPPTSLESAV